MISKPWMDFKQKQNKNKIKNKNKETITRTWKLRSPLSTTQKRWEFVLRITNWLWQNSYNVVCLTYMTAELDCIYEKHDERLIRNRNCLPFASPWVSPRCYLVRSMLLICLVFCVVILCVVTLWVPYCDVRYDFRIKTMFGCFLLHPVVCRREHALFTLFLFVFAQWCPKHIVLCFCFVFLCLLQPMLPVSLDCPFLIAPSVFSKVYLQISEGWGLVTSQSMQMYSRSMTVLRLSLNNFEVNVK